jgi:Na+-translocating ferredoxin:NAD+ oxidoreductase RnfD subunit
MMHPQLHQFVNLGLLLLLGKYVAHIYLPRQSMLAILFFTLFAEHLFLYLKEKKLRYFSFSALSTAIGVMLMMATPHLWILLTVIALGLLQKHFLQCRGEHFFNPSNFALIMGLLFFYTEAHIVMGQLGDDRWLEIFVLLLGISILVRVDRWIIPVVFILSYLLLQDAFIVSSDPVLLIEDLYRRFYSVSFIVFILFMLTDPRTTPKKFWHQAVFAILVAFGSTLLDYYNGFRVQHLFMSLFFLSPPVLLLSKWEERSIRKKLVSLTAVVLFLALGAIIYIELQPPYYFEMDN